MTAGISSDDQRPGRNSSARLSNMVTITGAGDHDRTDWLITTTGIRRETGGPPRANHRKLDWLRDHPNARLCKLLVQRSEASAMP
jgi:hypothetical protein